MWIASLSNGETVSETAPRQNELSPWQHLLMRCKADNLRITQLRLQVAGRTFHAIPNADGYVCAYEVRSALNSKQQQTFQIVGSVDTDLGLVFVTKVNQQGDSWQEVRPLGSLHVHSTVREQRDLIVRNH